MSTLSKKDTTQMRGVAISFIVLHNLIHLVCPVKENEYVFDISNSQAFITNLCEMNLSFWKDIFSFLGWYGITIFLFISGYGLVCKYENGGATDDISSFAFIKKHISKLFCLMLIPYLLYILCKFLLSGTLKSFFGIFMQLSMLSNIMPRLIDPGVYWYFGLMAQFYMFYRIFIYSKKNTAIIIWNIISLVLMITFINIPNNTIMSDYVSNFPARCLSVSRHNFIGWILPFTLGVIYARLNLSITFSKQWINVLSVVVCVALLIISNLNVYAWLLSPVLSILCAIYFCSICNQVLLVNNVFTYLGGISAFLFAVHPVIRYIYSHLTGSLNIFTVSVYFVVCVVVAICYMYLHKKLFA